MLLAFGGCAGEAPKADHAAPSAPQKDAQAAGDAREIWEALFIGGTRVGHSQTTIRPVGQDGRSLVRIEGLTRLAATRDGTPVAIEIRFWSLETPEGRVLEFESSTPAMRFRGRVAGDQLHVTARSAGRTEEAARPWSPDHRGFFGPQQILWQSPMQPGQRRSVSFLDPSSGEVATSELAAGDYESVRLLDGTRKLLRIDTKTTLAGQVLAGALWSDSAGDILKTWTDLLQSETYRTTKAAALAQTAPGDLDLIRDIAIPVARPLARPHETRRVRYRVRLEGGNPAEAFVSGASQQVKPIDERTAEVTVFAVRPGAAGNRDARDDPPGEADRKPTSLVQSDDPKIAAAAAKAAGGATDPWQVAAALERYVHQAIRDKDYAQAFDSAADALASGRGDCTEHAVLLAALARARGIPARAAIGLVYVDQKFLYHMWTEVHIAGRWIPLDATRARGGTSGAYLTLAHTSLETASAYASLLPVARVAGKLAIEILDAE